MKIDFKTFEEVVPHILACKHPVMIRGRHGIGKSELVYQTAKEMGLRVVQRRASQMTEGDLVGLPVLNDGSTSWNPPDWFKDACENHVMLFLDEVDRAVIEVRQGIFELTDSRQLNGHKLHPGTVVIAAVNGGEESGEHYQVGEMDPAELDRWTTFDVNPTIDDWMRWGKTKSPKTSESKIASVILDFISQHPEHLEHTKDFQPNKKYPSRRSWKRFSDALTSAHLLDEWSKKIRLLGLGYLGHEAAITFSDFFEKYEKLVTAKDIINKGKIELTKEFGLIEHCALILKIENSKLMEKKMTKKQITNMAAYFVTLPSEAAMKLWFALSAGLKENTINFHRCEVGDKTVSGCLKEMLVSRNS